MNEYPIQPFPSDSEPSACADLPATEAENEVTVCIFFERNASFDEFEMSVSVLA